MDPELERNLHSRVIAIDEEIRRTSAHEYTSAAFRRVNAEADGPLIMDVAHAVGNTTHEAGVRQAIYGFGFAIGLELFAHAIDAEHRKAFILELATYKSIFDMAQRQDAPPDDINTAISLSEEAYNTYQERRAIHGVSEKVWRCLESGSGNVADFETAIGMIGLAITNSQLALESGSGEERPFDLFDLFKEPLEVRPVPEEAKTGTLIDIEGARGIILRSFERNPHVRKLREGHIVDRAELLAGLGRAIISLNSGPANLPFLETGIGTSILGGSFYMIYDRETHTKTYHRLPEGWRLSGSFERFVVDEIPLLDMLNTMGGKTKLEEFATTYPAGLFMLLGRSTLNYGDDDMPLSRNQSVHVPLNYPLRGTLLSVPTAK